MIKEYRFDEGYEPYLETKQCGNSCSHFDGINQCCWLVTGKSGLFTEVSEYDSCIHGFKEGS